VGAIACLVLALVLITRALQALGIIGAPDKEQPTGRHSGPH
jgi:hypothetical protein